MEDIFEKNDIVYEKIGESKDFLLYKKSKKILRLCDNFHIFIDKDTNKELGNKYYDTEEYFDENNNLLDKPYIKRKNVEIKEAKITEDMILKDENQNIVLESTDAVNGEEHVE